MTTEGTDQDRERVEYPHPYRWDDSRRTRRSRIRLDLGSSFKVEGVTCTDVEPRTSVLYEGNGDKDVITNFGTVHTVDP